MGSLKYRSSVLQPGRTGFVANPEGRAHLSPQPDTGKKLVTVLVTIGGSEVFRDTAAQEA